MLLAPPLNARPPRDALVLDEARLFAWLEANLEGCRGGQMRVLQFKGGQSNPTYWIGVEGGGGGDLELVLRKKPPGKLLPSAHAIEREHRVLSALQGSPVPVPRVLALCEDSSIIGTPFFVMRFVAGRIFWQATLPELGSMDDRRAVYAEYARVLAAIHTVDYAAAGLSDYGKVGGFVARQVERWSKQYEASRTSDLPAMEALMRYLASNVPTRDETTLVHGDYRLDNLIITPSGEPRVIATLDWELSTLGHPVSDLAYACIGYHLNLPGRGGLAGVDLAPLGIPTEDELVHAYCKHAGRAGVEDWSYFLAFGVFRIAAIVQGVYRRSQQGNASSDEAASYGAAVGILSELGCSLAGVRPG